MADTALKVEGLGTLIRTLKDAGIELDDLKAASEQAGRIVLSAAVARAPRRTGALAGAGKSNRATRRAVVTFGSARVPYAAPIHWGWPRRNIRPQPFASQAAQATEPVWVAAYVAEIERIAATVQGV